MKLDELLTELRRVEKSRVDLTNDKIRKIHNSLLRELNGFLGNYWIKFSDDDGRLSVLQLKNANRYSRFLEEIKKKVNNLSSQEKELITDVVEQTYKKSYEGMINAFKKAEEKGDLAEVTRDIKVRPEIIKESFNNDLGKVTLPDVLEKNRINVLYDVQQAINIGLMNGDRYDTVAKAVKAKLETGYSNALRIVKTETHRNIEGGLAEGAKDISKGLEGSDYVMVAIWRTMQDERVRPQVRVKNARGKWITVKAHRSGANHQKMEGKAIVVGDKFDLGNGVYAECPGKSGSAENDINCRCFLEYKLVSVEEASKLTGKSAEEIEKILDSSKLPDNNVKKEEASDPPKKEEATASSEKEKASAPPEKEEVTVLTEKEETPTLQDNSKKVAEKNLKRDKIDWIQNKTREDQIEYFGGGYSGRARKALLDSGVITTDEELDHLYKINEEGKRLLKTLQELEDSGIMTIREYTLDHVINGGRTNLKNPNEPASFENGGRPSGGFHSESSFEVLEELGFPGTVNETLPNGVRIGVIKGHKTGAKSNNNGQVWFPKDWTDDDILTAATAIINNPKNKIEDNKYSGLYKLHGENVKIIVRTNKPGTIYPDINNQPKE